MRNFKINIFIVVYLIIQTSLFSQSFFVPAPQRVAFLKSDLSFNSSGIITYSDTSLRSTAEYLSELLNKSFRYSYKTQLSNSPSNIHLQIKAFNNKEEYELSIEKGIVVYGSKAGIFYGAQSLFQLLLQNNGKKIPQLMMNDFPAFSWRGAHLDVSRHFFSVEFIKKYIDILAFHKLNTFHWHLTDDQGWRIEIKKYPLLTSVGSVRKGSTVGHYRDHEMDTIPYGGFYTQNEIKEIIQYAAIRNIQIIPEIEMPGHSSAVLAAYPNLGCKEKNYKVQGKYGVFDDVFCTKPETFEFLENVLSEVAELFPSEIIHIGGDECPKTRWKDCETCKKNILDNKLKDENELQSWFIQKIEKFLNSKNKKIIGWDEILEGGLAPNAAVMSWRGEAGGIAAAKQKHPVVMSPGSHCYFDHYQGDPQTEPLAIGGNTTLQKVYAYNPIPAGLSEEEKKFILGAQANVWTEYMTNSDQVEYMLLPRISALAEVLWLDNKKPGWNDFSKRCLTLFTMYDQLNYKASRSAFTPQVSIVPSINKNDPSPQMLQLKTDLPIEIRFTVDGKIPIKTSALFSKNIEIDTAFNLKAQAFYQGKAIGSLVEKRIYPNIAYGKKISFTYEPNSNFSKDTLALTDGLIRSSENYYSYAMAWAGKNAEIIIDLGNDSAKSKSYTLNLIFDYKNEIYLPHHIDILSSPENRVFYDIALKKPVNSGKGRIRKIHFDTRYPAKNRYLKIILHNPDQYPDTKRKGYPERWILVDEIIVN